MPTQEVEKVTTMVTKMPSGIVIEYEPKPHTYRIRKGDEEWRPAMAVSTAIDALKKGGLTWWGMEQGVQSLLTCWDQGKIKRATDGRLAVFGQSAWEYATKETVVNLFKREKMTVNHVRDAAGDRGQNVHDALEAWLLDGTMPVPEFWVNPDGSPSVEQGYVKGLLKFLQDVGKPKSKPMSEVMIASYEHGFAGRYDMEMVLHEARLCVKLATPAWNPEPGAVNHHSAKGPQYETFSGRTVFDLKTPKSVYASHHLQLALYECARIESGFPKSEQRIVIRVNTEGEYEAVPSRATIEDGLAVLAVARAVERIEKG